MVGSSRDWWGRRSELPDRVSGIARVDTRTKRLVTRVQPGEVMVKRRFLPESLPARRASVRTRSVTGQARSTRSHAVRTNAVCTSPNRPS